MRVRAESKIVGPGYVSCPCDQSQIGPTQAWVGAKDGGTPTILPNSAVNDQAGTSALARAVARQWRSSAVATSARRPSEAKSVLWREPLVALTTKLERRNVGRLSNLGLDDDETSRRRSVVRPLGPRCGHSR